MRWVFLLGVAMVSPVSAQQPVLKLDPTQQLRPTGQRTPSVRLKPGTKLPSLFPALVGLRIEKRVHAVPQTMSRQAAHVRVVMNGDGAVVRATLEASSGDPTYDRAALNGANAFGVRSKMRLPVPTDPRILEQVTGPGIVVRLNKSGALKRKRPIIPAALLRAKGVKAGPALRAPDPKEK